MTDRRLTPRTVILALGVLLAAFAIWWFGLRGWTDQTESPNPAVTFEGDLCTDHLPDPILLTDGDTTLKITRFVFRTGRPDQNQGRDDLMLEEDDLTFDDYGDATRTGGKPPTTYAVELRKSKNQNDLYDVVFPDDRFRNRLKLVIADPTAGIHRLVIHQAERTGSAGPERILELRRPDVKPDALGNAPQADRFHFETLAPQSVEAQGKQTQRLFQIGVSGSIAEGGQLDLDPNYLLIHEDGSIGGSTQMGWKPIKVSFRPLGPDCTAHGRRAFELVPADPSRLPSHRYILVLAATELGPHRLVVKSEGRVQQVLPLQDTKRNLRRRS